MRHALVIATVNRHDILTALLTSLRDQVVMPEVVVLSAPEASGIPPIASAEFPFTVLTCVGARGASAQRNKGVDALPEGIDTVAFLDDDSMPRRDFFAAIERHFEKHPETSALTGRVVLEGTGHLPNLTENEIQAALERSETDDLSTPPASPEAWNQLYGCNMVFRRSVFDTYRFDERLPLYSWLEDTDIARAILKDGGVIYRDPSVVIVHRKDASGGRSSHVRFGYSFVSNWAHLWRKGHVGVKDARGVVLVIGKNAVNSVRGPEKEWRRERLKGNLLALSDVMRGRITPERILDL